jgi:hypothetical protein
MIEKMILSDQARRHFRTLLDDAENNGIFTGIGRWNGPPTARVVSEEWYQEAKACLAEAAGGRRRAKQSSEEKKQP